MISDQASAVSSALASIVCGLPALSPPPMLIFRGFIASGISRTSSIASRPSFRSAPRTWIWSASAKRRSNERVGDAAVDIVGAALLGLLLLLAADDQHVLLGGDVDLFGLEAGDRQLDAIIVVAELDQVERRIVFLALAGVLFSSMSNSRSKPTVERRNGAKSKALRMSCPPLEQQGGSAAVGGLSPVTGPDMAPGAREMVRKPPFSSPSEHLAEAGTVRRTPLSLAPARPCLPAHRGESMTLKEFLFLPGNAQFADLGLLLLRVATGVVPHLPEPRQHLLRRADGRVRQVPRPVRFVMPGADGAALGLRAVPRRHRLHPRPVHPLARPDHLLQVHRRGVDGPLARPRPRPVAGAASWSSSASTSASAASRPLRPRRDVRREILLSGADERRVRHPRRHPGDHGRSNALPASRIFVGRWSRRAACRRAGQGQHVATSSSRERAARCNALRHLSSTSASPIAASTSSASSPGTPARAPARRLLQRRPSTGSTPRRETNRVDLDFFVENERARRHL